MINTLLTYDDKDSELGEFFEACANDTKNETDATFSIIEIKSQQLNELMFQLNADSINENPFIFISFTHGSESELLKNGITPFVSESLNASCLRNSLAYCYACKSGKKFGHTLIENNALAFVGFTSELKIQKYFNAFNSFIDCATSGIKFFLTGDNLENSVAKMKAKYTNYMDDLYITDMVTASWFMEHRDALTILGNSNLQIADFNTPESD